MYVCVTIYRAAPVVTVEADIVTPDNPLVLEEKKYECTAGGGTTVVCFIVSVCFNYSILQGDSIEKFSKKHFIAVVFDVTILQLCHVKQEAICIYVCYHTY